jgi:hypothetical protein
MFWRVGYELDQLVVAGRDRGAHSWSRHCLGYLRPQ